jgi:epoxide hydrolase 4
LQLTIQRSGQGVPVLLLHGFPELARYWSPLMSALADGFDCVAPDQRGCGASPRPEHADDYTVDALLGDVLNLLDRLHWPQCHLVGHDWGGILAWWFAARHPERVRKLVVFNAPHPAALQARLLNDARQQQASSYMRVLQQRHAAAQLLADGPAAFWSRLRGTAEGFNEADRLAYLQAWGAPEGLVGPCAWYRMSPMVLPDANATATAAVVDWHLREPLTVAAPTLVAWGMQDRTFVPELLTDSLAFAPHSRALRFEHCLHNVPREAVAQSAALLREFFSQAGA